MAAIGYLTEYLCYLMIVLACSWIFDDVRELVSAYK